ncbi:MAG: hypothetical protein WCJ30_10295, partial [Deltaproteobacteria bacterium]
MHLGIRGRLLALSIAVILTGLVGTQWYVSSALESDMDRREQSEMAVRADVTAAGLTLAGEFDGDAAERYVRAQSVANRARVTLIAPGGRVVADSSVTHDRVASLENHASRPEVRDAVRTGTGISQRASATIGEPLTYVARRVDGPGGAWVLRLAVSPQRFEAAHSAIHGLLL